MAIVAIALIVGIVLCFTTPIGQVFGNILTKINEQAMGDIWGYGAYEPGGNGGGENSNPEVMTRLEGDGQEFYTLAPTPLSFRSTAPMSELQEVQINGVTVDPSNYTVTEGSTVVTFPIEYLKTLEADDYEVTVVSESMSPKGDFTVVAPELNEYGFYYNQPYVGYVQGYGNVALFYRENGVLDFIITATGYIETATYTVSGNAITNNVSLGVIPATISNGDEIQCAALGATFKLGDASIAADADYMYIYKEDLGGYEVTVIDKKKAEYGAIKTGINGIDTTSINRTYMDCNNLKKVKIPNTVIYMDDYTFYFCNALEEVVFQENSKITLLDLSGCSSLKNITIPESVTSINFSGCSSLIKVVIPDSVSMINFLECSSLVNVTIGNGVKNIGHSVFVRCSNLVDITIPNSVERIEIAAFGECTSLTSVTIPDSVSFIGQTAFGDCTNLTNISFNGTVAQWEAIDKHGLWNENVPATYVQCSDGQVPLN